jgi:hypothetical protein
LRKVTAMMRYHIEMVPEVGALAMQTVFFHKFWRIIEKCNIYYMLIICNDVY